MSEIQSSQPELPYAEAVRQGWSVLETEPEIASIFEYLSDQTRTAANAGDHGKIYEDEHDLHARWQQAAQLTSRLTAQPWTHNEQPEVAEVLRHGVHAMANSIQKYSWVIPGISFRVLEEGYEWIEREGLQPNASMFDTVDIRDMDNPPPLVEMSQDEFNALSEQEVEALRRQANANLMVKLHGSGLNYTHNVPKVQTAIRDAYSLSRLQTNRRYGVPDREVSREDVGIYLRELVAWRQAANPKYANVPADFEELPQPLKQAAGYILEYFMDMRDPYKNDTGIDTYSLMNTIGLEAGDINGLVDADILKPKGSYQGPDGGLYATYELSRPYYEFWWVNSVLDEQDD